jgi:hypothetical protein
MAGDKKLAVNVQANKISKQELSGYQGFIENNGFVAIQATHCNRQKAKLTKEWKVVNDLGYTGNVLQAFPLAIEGTSLTALDAIRKSNASVEYDFYTFTSATPSVTVFALPTHPINNNHRVRYAVSIDDGELKMVDMKTFGRSEEWKQNVLRNRAERKIKLPYLNAGKHTLKIYCVDPGVILDEIRIDLGGLKKAYSTLPETKIQ